MDRKRKRFLWLPILSMLLCALLVFVAVFLTVHCSHDVGFTETAARTDRVLSLISLVLAGSIFAFSIYTARRHRSER